MRKIGYYFDKNIVYVNFRTLGMTGFSQHAPRGGYNIELMI